MGSTGLNSLPVDEWSVPPALVLAIPLLRKGRLTLVSAGERYNSNLEMWRPSAVTSGTATSMRKDRRCGVQCGYACIPPAPGIGLSITRVTRRRFSVRTEAHDAAIGGRRCTAFDVDVLGVGAPWQPWHAENARHHDQETCPGIDVNVAHGQNEVLRSAKEFGVIGQRTLCLCDADGKVAVTSLYTCLMARFAALVKTISFML